MNVFYKSLWDVCMPIGTRNREFYLSHGVKEERLFAVPYVVDNSYFINAARASGDREKIRLELGLPRHKTLLMSASKMIARKRPMDVLEAFHRLRKEGLDAGLFFVGSGELEAVLKDYVRQNDLSDVYFFGFRNQTELPKFYSAADIFVFPSENEPWGLILNEVMCAGLPVVVSREIGAARDLVCSGENGFTFEAGNVDELTRQLAQVIGSPEAMREMGERSRNIIGQWSHETCVRGIRNALKYLSIQSSSPVETQHA